MGKENGDRQRWDCQPAAAGMVTSWGCSWLCPAAFCHLQTFEQPFCNEQHQTLMEGPEVQCERASALSLKPCP